MNARNMRWIVGVAAVVVLAWFWFAKSPSELPAATPETSVPAGEGERVAAASAFLSDPATESVANESRTTVADADSDVGARALVDSTTPSKPGARTRVIGRVVDRDGEPIVGADVRLDAVDSLAPPTRSDPDGKFSIEYAGRLIGEMRGLLASSRRHAARMLEVVGVPERIEDSKGPLERIDVGDVVLERGGTISGRVMRPNRDPVEGAMVQRVLLNQPESELESHRRSSGRMMGFPWPFTRTSADGSFELTGLPAERVRLVASAPEHLATFSEILDVEDGQWLEGVNLVLEPITREDQLFARVFAPDGAPLAHAQVRGWHGLKELQLPTTDADGRFQVLLPRRVVSDVAAIDSTGRLFAQALDVPLGQDVELALRPMREVPATVIDPDGAAVPRARIHIYDARSSGFLLATGLEPTFALVPEANCRAVAIAEGFADATLGPFDGASVDRLDFVLQATTTRTERPAKLKIPVGSSVRLDGEFRGAITVDGLPPEGVWTLHLGRFETENKSGALDIIQLDRNGRFAWQRPAEGAQALIAFIVGGPFDGVIVADTLNVSTSARTWRLDLRSAKMKVEIAGAMQGCFTVWTGDGSAFALRKTPATGEFPFFAGPAKLVDAAKPLRDLNASSWPALVSGTAVPGEVLVLRAP